MNNGNLLTMVVGAGPVVQGVLVILIVLSLWSWAITIAKALQLKRVKADSEEFGRIFWETRNISRVADSCERLAGTPLVPVFQAGCTELKHLMEERGGGRGSAITEDELATLALILKRAEQKETLGLERGVTFLATVASAAPFIGLFGTVWGIMNAFHGLSSVQSTTLQAVAPGISEALVATALGLAAAIPAAVAYNYFAVAIKNVKESLNRFRSEFLRIAERSLQP